MQSKYKIYKKQSDLQLPGNWTTLSSFSSLKRISNQIDKVRTNGCGIGFPRIKK